MTMLQFGQRRHRLSDSLWWKCTKVTGSNCSSECYNRFQNLPRVWGVGIKKGSMHSGIILTGETLQKTCVVNGGIDDNKSWTNQSSKCIRVFFDAMSFSMQKDSFIDNALGLKVWLESCFSTLRQQNNSTFRQDTCRWEDVFDRRRCCFFDNSTESGKRRHFDIKCNFKFKKSYDVWQKTHGSIWRKGIMQKEPNVIVLGFVH